MPFTDTGFIHISRNLFLSHFIPFHNIYVSYIASVKHMTDAIFTGKLN